MKKLGNERTLAETGQYATKPTMVAIPRERPNPEDFLNRPVDPLIQPLVDSINSIGIVKVIDSSPGKYEGKMNRIHESQDFAFVSFRLLEPEKAQVIESAFGAAAYIYWKSDNNTLVAFSKKIIGPSPVDTFYHLAIAPKDDFDFPENKRFVTDVAIGCLKDLVLQTWEMILGKHSTS